MIDKDGYRLNVGIILSNDKGQLFWGKRVKSKGWQFPQGGVQPYETLIETMYRELQEELGLSEADVKILGVTKRWQHYKLPVHMRRSTQKPICIGQKQKWFLLLLSGNDNKIKLNFTKKPEFTRWRWVEYWAPLEHVIYFKRDIYRKVLSELEPLILTKVKN